VETIEEKKRITSDEANPAISNSTILTSSSSSDNEPVVASNHLDGGSIRHETTKEGSNKEPLVKAINNHKNRKDIDENDGLGIESLEEGGGPDKISCSVVSGTNATTIRSTLQCEEGDNNEQIRTQAVSPENCITSRPSIFHPALCREDIEEAKEEIPEIVDVDLESSDGTASRNLMSATNRDSCKSVASSEPDDDERSSSDLCAICLGNYASNDELILAKYCTHCFHRECILEWLERHNDCPICRSTMITENELSQVAALLNGKGETGGYGVSLLRGSFGEQTNGR